MQILKSSTKSDILGASASILCLVHCAATPFIFVTQASIASTPNKPEWWGILDLLFLVLSFVAIWMSIKNSSRKWMKLALASSWSLMAFLVLNEKLDIIPLMEQAIYIPALSLVFFHLFNLKYCRCSGDSCCTHTM